MIRTPLRPLARILKAREEGENPDAIEKENIRLRHEAMADRARMRAESRLLVLGLFFFCLFVVIGGRMALLASSEPTEPRSGAGNSSILSQRSDIIDREGRVLATNIETFALYAHPRQMVDPRGAADGLAAVFEDLDAAELYEDFTGSRSFLWIKRRISPEQMQEVHDIGEPGLLFGPREMRLYPNGPIAAHVLGGTRYGEEQVSSAEVVGVAGVEGQFDAFLRDPAHDGAPLQLSIDLAVQATTEQVLAGGMALMNAKGASAVLMDVHTGEIVSLVSLPDFDPNTRPPIPAAGDAADSPLFNRAVQGVYELGSVFKVFTVAQALDLGLVNPGTEIDTTGPLHWGSHRIRDFRDYGPTLRVVDVLVRSSNIGTARIAMMIGIPRQQDFLRRLGFLSPTEVELIEASSARPILPENWSEISTMTISYGHGLSSSPVHVAAGFSSMVNGGFLVEPTLLRTQTAVRGERVISAQASDFTRQMLRQVVVRGTASFGEVEGYAVGGKTGTADKPTPRGGYYEDRVIATFASAFPAHDPQYVLIVTLDEPTETSGDEPRRTAGWTAVPVAAEVIRRVAPLLGLAPGGEPEPHPLMLAVDD